MSSEVRQDTIFISHASPDLEQATEIYLRLKDKDYPVWMAVHEVMPGANYAEIISKTLDAAKAVIVLISKASILSDHVKREVGLANQLDIPLYAISFEQLIELQEAFIGDWSNWLNLSAIKPFQDEREAARFLIDELKSEFDHTGQNPGLDENTLLWIDNASVLIKTLLDIPDSEFDFVSFNFEMHNVVGYQIDQLSNNIDNEGKATIGEFLYSCYWTFTSLRPNWVPDDAHNQQLLLSSYLIPSSVNFKHPEAMNSLSFKLLNQDIDTFINWVEENYDFKSVLDRSIQVGERTPIEDGVDFEEKKDSNSFGFLTFSAGLRLFAAFYTAQRSQRKIEEALEWLNDFESVAKKKDIEYLKQISPTPAIQIWYPLVNIFSAFFHYKKGEISTAREVLSKMGQLEKAEFENMAHTQSQSDELADEYRQSWSELESMLINCREIE